MCVEPALNGNTHKLYILWCCFKNIVKLSNQNTPALGKCMKTHCHFMQTNDNDVMFLIPSSLSEVHVFKFKLMFILCQLSRFHFLCLKINVENSSSVPNWTIVKSSYAYLIHKRDIMIICTELRVLSKARRSINKI